mmetsp:Transcript_151315/g.367548  ORF Transcript_151315/g.367548 Transcript_151315/m.367548 type:complete len:207 (-) Transcript_151315:939-1559(-)
MLILPLLRGLCHLLVQGLDPGLEGRDLISQGLDAILRRGNGVLLIGHGPLQGLLLVITEVKLCDAVLLLVIVVGLLLLQDLHHVVDHLDDLVKGPLARRPFARQRQHQEFQAWLPRAISRPMGLLKRGQGSRADFLEVHAHLQEASAGSAWQSLLEQFEGIVVVEDFDGLCKRYELIRTGLRALLPLTRLCLAALVQLREELLVLI